MLMRYLANLSRGRLILWWYFIWYCVVLVRYFDPSLRLWLTSIGLSLIIGTALYLSTTATESSPKARLEGLDSKEERTPHPGPVPFRRGEGEAAENRVNLDFWKTLRLFLMPFFVSSFAAMVKGKGFVLIFSPHPGEILVALAGCAALSGLVFLVKSRQA